MIPLYQHLSADKATIQVGFTNSKEFKNDNNKKTIIDI